ncbi:MAG: hypothetical protein J7K29_04645, partial [Candidatus Cloacimonetes bacterium]|nr:hypothetical protein [Candidatus Cloacimonadota bacterium]
MSLTPKEEAVLDLIKEDNAYENYFFKKVSDIKWFYPLKERGYFSPEKAPGPKPADKEGYFIPYWNVLDYLEKVSQQARQPENEKYADELLKIIKNVTEYHIKNSKKLDNYHTWRSFVEILCNIPNEKIDDAILDLIPIWLDSKFDNELPASEIVEKLLPKFLDSDSPDNWKKAEKIVEIVTQIKWVPKYTPEKKKELREEYKHIFEKPENERTDEEKLQVALLDLDKEEPKTIVDTYRFPESFISKETAIKIGEKCSEKVIFNLANNLKGIFGRENPKSSVDYSYIWLRSMFDISEDISGVEKTLALILRDILLSKAKKDKYTARNIFGKFLGSDYPYPLFKRLVLFVVGSEWNTYEGIFWKMLDEDKEAELFNSSYYEPEVYTILQRNVARFSIEKKEKIKNIIEKKVPQKSHPEEKYRKYYDAHEKQKWYSALKSDDYFKPMYEKYKNITKEEEEIGFKEQVRVGPGSSPLNKEDIVKMSNEELAKYLKEFKTVDRWKGPTVGGLREMLKEVAQENPQKFIEKLEPFLDTGYLYVYHILWGIHDAWEKKKIIDWEPLLIFVKNYITPKDFWEDKYKVEDDDWNADHLWVIGIVAQLIRAGTVNDSWAFSEKHFKMAYEILIQSLN